MVARGYRLAPAGPSVWRRRHHVRPDVSSAHPSSGAAGPAGPDLPRRARSLCLDCRHCSTVGLVESGFGIHALAVGWACTQILGAGLAWWRAPLAIRQILPPRLPPMALGTARAELGRGIWISVSQIAQVLLNGTDLLVIGMLLGPAAIVPYACTGKLVTLLANQPQLFMQTALPALSELRASVPQARLFQVSTSMSQLLLMCSGAIACVVLTVNEAFVSWWVGGSLCRRRLDGGARARDAPASLERRSGLHIVLFRPRAPSGDHDRRRRPRRGDRDAGARSMARSIRRRPWFAHRHRRGQPARNLRALAREEGVRVAAAIRPLGPWFGRFAAAIALVLAAITSWPARGLAMGTAAGSAVALLYLILVVVPVARRPPLGTMLNPRMQPVLAFLRQLARRLAGQATP